MRIIKDNALSLVLFTLFVIFWVGQAIAGWGAENEQRAEHGQPRVEWNEYLTSGHFWEATAENWESEFLQMAGFVVLSAFLVQRGSAESKKPDDEDNSDHVDDKTQPSSRPLREDEKRPWPVRKGGFYLTIYNHSLSLVLTLMFVGAFVIHAFAGRAAESTELLSHGEPPVGLWEFLSSPTFWFQSLQNWQSEFLSIAVLVVLTIFLRERGSPQSKPVEAPHRMTGSS
jgi:hypothetical protein